MLRRIALRDFVIVTALEVELDAGFTVLTGETGAGKSILIDALQLALGARADAAVVREGAARAEISAEFDVPAGLRAWLDEAGFDTNAGDTLLLRRVIDSQGRSRAWVNGSAATAMQLREAADRLVDIHGQHAWQSLGKPAAVRELLDEQAGVDARALALAFMDWRDAERKRAAAEAQQTQSQREHERLAWQIAEVEKLAPGDDEWQSLDAEHRRLANAQALIDAARGALDLVSEADDNAARMTARAIDGLAGVESFDTRLGETAEVLRGAQAQLDEAAHALSVYLARAELDPERLSEVDARMSAWVALARRWRCPPAELPRLLAGWNDELKALDASSDIGALADAATKAQARYASIADATSAARRRAAPPLAEQVTNEMQQLGMAGGRFEIALPPAGSPQAHGLESVEFLVAAHAGATPRPVAKVASGGELSRLALAVAVTTASADAAGPATLIFDEVDSGVGGSVAGSVGRLLRQLGRSRQVLAVTHLPQVAACADHHLVVDKRSRDGSTASDVKRITGAARAAEVARMLGATASETSLAHARQLLAAGAEHVDLRGGEVVLADEGRAASPARGGTDSR